MTTLHHPQGDVSVKELPNSRRRIEIHTTPTFFVSSSKCETSYPLDLISLILNIFGPAYLCDEINREETPSYVRGSLEKTILAHVSAEQFKNKRLLDFGCGAGSSTMILARLFPQTQILGIDMVKDFLKIAHLRSQHYQCSNRVTFFASENIKIPEGIGKFDFIVLNAMYEHLLPNERNTLLEQLWSILKPNGVLFINETPFRYYPIETHTTELPLINYLPQNMAFAIVRKYSSRVNKDETWANLLRRGIRGATEREILNNIKKMGGTPILLKPSKLGFNDRIDLWYIASFAESNINDKRNLVYRTYEKIYRSSMLRFFLKIILKTSGIAFVHLLTLAIQKEA
jgi:2-polyprenyl-3-methyl-5-hydroxy-6-metoxy-1,4-benzoquinol methylase